MKLRAMRKQFRLFWFKSGRLVGGIEILDTVVYRLCTVRAK